MALIKCPECEQSISDKASTCPKCGYPILGDSNSKAEDIKISEVKETPNTLIGKTATIEFPTKDHQVPTQMKSKNKIAIALIVACVVAFASMGVALVSNLFASKLTVEDITISKWNISGYSDFGCYYEGTITSEHNKPFVAIIGQYYGDQSPSGFAYVEDGKGVIEIYEETDEHPSIKYRPLGYMDGKPVDISDIKVNYSDSNYRDWSHAEVTGCDIKIDIDLNNSKNGLLVFDIIDETNNETERNVVAIVIDGKAQYSNYAEMPYKSRGIDLSIVPKFFCESVAIKQADYEIKKAYSVNRIDELYFNGYEGEVTFSFPTFDDGFIIYSCELTDGGQQKNRNIVNKYIAFLRNGECTLETYDAVYEDDETQMPEYDFNIIGYIPWTLLL